MALKKNVLAALLIGAFIFSAHAQDIHFTQFGAVPLTVNPAQTGLFQGSYRIQGLYRTQWNSGVKNGYQTPVINLDVPINGFRKEDWIGLGADFYSDKAGSAALSSQLIAIDAAYHFALDKKSESAFSAGFKIGFAQRSVNRDALRFQDAIVLGNGAQSADYQLINAAGKTFTDMAFGLNFRGVSGNKLKTIYNIGVSAEHLLGPSANYFEANSKVSELPRRFNIHATVDVPLGTVFAVYPGAIVRYTSTQTEIQGQILGGLKINPKENIELRAGLGYRVGDAAQIIGGLVYGNIRVGIAYDLTLGDLRTNNAAKDGFEIAVGYIGSIKKKPNPPPVILCPKY